jgi:hypothetical protein
LASGTLPGRNPKLDADQPEGSSATAGHGGVRAPAERVRLYLKQRFLSHRLHGHYPDIVDAICEPWNRLTAR